ncbi:MAG: hypothetical protein HQL98_08770 [Magnetococcales bacterium]|nr:hypothetical protein [Magnetococcales bacterium]
MNKRSIIYEFFLLLMLWYASEGLCSDTNGHRLQLGIKIFPALVGGNLDLASQTNKDGTLLLLIVYGEDRGTGENLVRMLNTSTRVIDHYPIQVVVCMVSEFRQFADRPVAGIFLAESLKSAPMEEIIVFGIAKKSIIFSPFEGDVQNGVMAGMEISTQVKPALNLVTLRKSGIRLNSLFIKVAKIYGEN